MTDVAAGKTRTAATADPRTDPLAEALSRVYRLRADAFYVRQQDGVWLGNSTGSFSVRGQGAHDLVASLFAGLDGERTLHDLYGELPDRARRTVLGLVRAMLANGFLKEVAHPVEPVPGWMRERYATHLAFLEHHADRPVTRLQQVRIARVVCAGAGTALYAVLDALREFGIARLDVIPDGDDDPDAVRQVLKETAAADPGARWRLREPLTGGPETLAGHPDTDGAGLVLLAYDTVDAGALARAQHALWRRGPVGVLARCGDFVTALAPGRTTAYCWECVHRSIAARPTGDTGGLAPAVAPAAIGALRLAQHAFALLAGVPVGGDKPLTTVEPLVPAVRAHAARRHPRCPHHEPAAPRPLGGDGPGGAVPPADGVRPDDLVRPDIPRSEDPPERVRASDRIVAACADLTDAVAGPLLALGEEDLPQLPLSASSCRVADPDGSADRPAVLDVVCRALSPREARNQAVLCAVEALAARVTGADARHGVVGAGWSLAEARLRARLHAALARPAGDLHWTPAPERRPPAVGFLAGVLDTEGVPWSATAVEELPGGVVRAHVRTADGTVTAGAGTDRERAVGHALLGAVARLLPRPGDADAATAFLAPAVPTWAAALTGPAPGDEHEITGKLPFLGEPEAFMGESEAGQALEPEAATRTAPETGTGTAPEAVTRTGPEAVTRTGPEAVTRTGPEAATRTAPETGTGTAPEAATREARTATRTGTADGHHSTRIRVVHLALPTEAS
ncbi:hypothetical protein ABZ202_27305 [Streptomyces sp. NPDC006186]|uniref:hypothetical protein n=1 Tax=Streptomyces sp. NPDC006186 TaxID=3155248 RepID=UPI0033B11FC1